MTAHTAGPWKWYGSKSHIYLATPDRGRLIVMDFVRMGMASAQPRFAIRSDDMGGIMHKAQDLAEKKEYGDHEWIDLPNPDARMIAMAPELFDCCKELLDDVVRYLGPCISGGKMTRARAVLDAARGVTP